MCHEQLDALSSDDQIQQVAPAPSPRPCPLHPHVHCARACISRARLTLACRTMGIPEDRALMNYLVPPEEDPEGHIVQVCALECVTGTPQPACAHHPARLSIPFLPPQLCCDLPCGPMHIRALCAAILAKGEGMTHAGYTPLKSLRLWKNGAGDLGAAAVSELLRQGISAPVPGAEPGKAKPKKSKKGKKKAIAYPGVALTHVEIMDNEVGPEGAGLLGSSLMAGANPSLMTLVLDLNPRISDEGVARLFMGLRTNCSITKVSLSHCGVTATGAQAIADALRSGTSVITHLNLTGNAIGSVGLQALAHAAQSTTLTDLILTDNSIGCSIDPAENRTAMEALVEALTAESSALSLVDLDMNPLAPADAALLVDAVRDNERVRGFKVDASLPAELFDALNKAEKKGKKGKKGKGKGKKK